MNQPFNLYLGLAFSLLLTLSCQQPSTEAQMSNTEATARDNNDAPRTYAVIAAVADYKVGTKNDVRYTVNGARALYERVCGHRPKGAGVPSNQVRYVVNQQASKANILQQLDYLFRFARPQDRVLFYFSGHGLPGALVPFDVNPNASTPQQAGVLLNSELKKAFRKCRARTKLVLIEACHSGSLSMRQREALARQPISEPDEPDRDGNVMILMSSRANETSLEVNALRQGLFSYYLNEGLRGKADKDKNKIITARELYDYVSREVTAYASKLKHPQHPRAYGRFADNMVLINV